ncbi:DNA (cytosine-5-)-methyltransferase [Ranunculus cassubicifolius]
MTMMMKSTTTSTKRQQQVSKFIQSTLLIPRTKSKNKSSMNLRNSRDQLNSTVIEEDDTDLDAIDTKFEENLGFRSSKDVVWAKAYSHTWWPGWIVKEYRSKFLVSFFNSDNRSLWFYESEMRRFSEIHDYDFEEVSISRNNRREYQLDQDAIDSALKEYSRRLLSELTCSCQDEFSNDDEAEKRCGDVDVMKAFQPVGILEMVKNIAVSPSFDEMDSVSVIWAAAHVNAFRYYAFIKRDWIYEETMRLSEVVEDSEDNRKGTCPEDETENSFNAEPEYYEEEEIAEVREGDKEGKKEDSHNETICVLNSEDEYYNDEEEDKDGKQKEGEDEEDSNHNEFLDHIGIDSAVCKKNNKGHIEEEDSLWRIKIAANEAFKPIKILAFVHRMAVSTWVEDKDTNDVTKAASHVKRFRRHCYVKHDSDYWSIMRLSESTDDLEANMKSASCEDEQTSGIVQPLRLSDDDDKANSRELVDEGVNNNSFICKNIIEDPLYDTLNHLYCLAVDPFYSGVQRCGIKRLDSMSQRLLSYRKCVHQKVLDLNPRLKHPSYQDCVPDTSKDQKISRGSSIVHHQDVSDEIAVEESMSISNEEQNEESDLLIKLWNKRKKRARDEGRIADANISHSVTNIEDVFEEVSRNVVNPLRDRNDCKHESECNKRLKTKDVNACVSNNHVESRDVVEPYFPDCNNGADSSKRQKTEGVKVCSTNNMKSGGGVDASKETLVYILASKSSKMQKPESLEVGCSISNENGYVVEEITDPPDFTSESGSNKRQKICKYDSVSNVPQGSTKMRHGHDAASVKSDNHEHYKASHVLKDHINNKRHREADDSGRTKDLRAGCSLEPVPDRPGETMSQDIFGTQYEDGVRVGKKQCSSYGHHSYNNGDYHLSSDNASDLSNNQPTIISGGISEGHGKSSQLIINRIVELPQTNPLPPLNTLYISPLSAVSPAASGNTKFQPLKSHTNSDRPATLHMKFPKDFKLPSKDELVKKFRPFGPIDYLETKVYFYTGSAQVIFQHNLDAETACQCAKVEKIFGDNVRFWVSQRELSRRESMNTSVPSSLPRAGSSIPDLKSCLKVAKPQGMKAERKRVHVKFLSGNQVLQSVTPETKNEVLTPSDSCKYSKDLRPDISREMYVLLEKCNQMVTQIKDNLGIQTFYKLFTHNYCDKTFDEK